MIVHLVPSPRWRWFSRLTIACYSAAISSEPGNATGCRRGGIAGRWTKPVAATQFGITRGVSLSFLPEKMNRHRITPIILARKDEPTPDYAPGWMECPDPELIDRRRKLVEELMRVYHDESARTRETVSIGRLFIVEMLEANLRILRRDTDQPPDPLG